MFFFGHISSKVVKSSKNEECKVQLESPVPSFEIILAPKILKLMAWVMCLDMDGRYRQSIAGDIVLGEEAC